MKKLFILALCVLGMCNVSALGMVQEIILTELYSIIPFDDPGNTIGDVRPEPNRFHASVDGNELFVGADTSRTRSSFTNRITRIIKRHNRIKFG